MAERAGYDQPGDGYTNEYDTFGLVASQPYQPGTSGYEQPSDGYKTKNATFEIDAPPTHQLGTAENDRPGNEYTNKHATIEIDSPPSNHPGIRPSQQGFPQHPCPIQQPHANNTNTSVVDSQPHTGTVIYRNRPPDYLCASVLTCICCFWPAAICAIYYSIEAYILTNAGKYEGARRMSNNAVKFLIVSVVFGTIGIILSFVLYMVLIRKTSSIDYYPY